MKILQTSLLAGLGALTLAEEDFDCSKYVSTCSVTPDYQQYNDCEATVAANPGDAMACRSLHLGYAGLGIGNALFHCPHAQLTPTAFCDTEKLVPVNFDCDKYVSTCSDTPFYEEYNDCAATVKANPGDAMACRILHLSLAETQNTTIHCPHAQLAPTAFCDTEKLKAPNFDCDKYVSTCSDTPNYQPYNDCAATVAANPGDDMACRILHLGFAGASAEDKIVHCPHAQPTPTAFCDTEKLN